MGGTCVKPHPHFDGRGVPRFVVEAPLGADSRVERLICGVKRRRERIPHNLKNISILRLDGLSQYLIMSRQQGNDLVRVLLCQPGAALDVGKEESDRPAWKTSHGMSIHSQGF